MNLTTLLASLIAVIILVWLFVGYTMFWAALISITLAFWGYSITKGVAVALGMFIVLCRMAEKLAKAGAA